MAGDLRPQPSQQRLPQSDTMRTLHRRWLPTRATTASSSNAASLASTSLTHPQVWLAASLGRQTNTGVRSTRLTTHKSHAIRMTELCAAPPRTLQSQRPHFKPRHTCEGIACDIPEKPQHKAPQRASKAPRTTPSKKHPAGRRRLRHAQSRVANEAQGTTQARRHQRRGLITTPRMECPPRVG